MAALSNYFQNKLIDFLFRSGAYTVPTTLYIALCTTTPTASDTGSTIAEVSGGNYSRQAVSAGVSNWYSTQGDTTSTSSGTSGQTGNVNAITWSSVTWSATVAGIAICDAATAGNILWYSVLASSKTVASGDNASFPVNTLKPSLS